MGNLQRIYQLHRILASRTLPVSHQTLEQLLECSRATVNRTIESLRLYFNAPILYDRERNGYYYELRDAGLFELPGVWFDAQELHALLTMQQLLEQIQPGLLALQLKPMQERLKKILATQQLNDPDAVKRIRILTMLSRQPALQHFQSAASAVLQAATARPSTSTWPPRKRRRRPCAATSTPGGPISRPGRAAASKPSS